jgi:hypothetical protein
MEALSSSSHILPYSSILTVTAIMDEQAQVEIFNPLWMERREERLRSQAGEEVKGGEGSVIIKLGEGGLKGFRVIPVDDRHLGAMMILNSSLIHETVEVSCLHR